MHTNPGKKDHGDGGRNWSDVSIIQDTPRISCNHLLEARREARDCFPSSLLTTLTMPTPWLQTSSLQNWEWRHFYCFKPPSLWYHVTAALGSQSTITQKKQFLFTNKTIFITKLNALGFQCLSKYVMYIFLWWIWNCEKAEPLTVFNLFLSICSCKWNLLMLWLIIFEVQTFLLNFSPDLNLSSYIFIQMFFHF